ncbi:ketoacyl-ACP synthase III [Sporolactobacillus laevolacticus]|uniref:ketoacyl-ACP synthase III n=1 Tax=Sporolactobacillus laevolacticus TaxID=33018 RepID=UPI0025B338F4|nr:ketoacyl-ACP synthase III [Sporolactobacillus laevolacticus]MDN3956300.1 ketoacyl-ACP synthase III [Sporolactobacillus laevolacticus]
MESKAKITAIGGYVPERIMTNQDLEQIVDTSDEWIVRRTGMKERRIAGPEEFASDLACGAIRDLVKRYSFDLSDVDLVIVSTTTPDYGFPSVAAMIQAAFHLEHAGAFDLSAACAGFEYALHVANGLVSSGLNRKVLVVAAETMSKVTDYTDRTTCVLLGDGAGAAVIEQTESNGSFLGAYMGADGSLGKALYRTGLSTVMNGEVLINTGKMVQNGREVYKWAVKTVTTGIQKLLEENEFQFSDIDWFIPHSANLRLIEAIFERLNVPMDKVLYSLEYYGNTSSASIALSLSEAVKNGKIKKNDRLLLYGFGGGLCHCGQIIKWDL